jgi:hypothetical protein
MRDDLTFAQIKARIDAGDSQVAELGEGSCFGPRE